MELKSDETNVVIVEGALEVTRTITERYEVEEMERTLSQMGLSLDRFDEQKNEIEVMRGKLAPKEIKEFIEKTMIDIRAKRKKEVDDVLKKTSEKTKEDS